MRSQPPTLQHFPPLTTAPEHPRTIDNAISITKCTVKQGEDKLSKVEEGTCNWGDSLDGREATARHSGAGCLPPIFAIFSRLDVNDALEVTNMYLYVTMRMQQYVPAQVRSQKNSHPTTRNSMCEYKPDISFPAVIKFSTL